MTPVLPDGGWQPTLRLRSELAGMGFHWNKIAFRRRDLVIFVSKKPEADHHFLIVPKLHINTVDQLSRADIPMLQEMGKIGEMIGWIQLQNLEGTIQNDPEMVFHRPASVPHLHLHVLAGRNLPHRKRHVEVTLEAVCANQRWVDALLMMAIVHIIKPIYFTLLH